MVEVNAETDFVARNETFQALVAGRGARSRSRSATMSRPSVPRRFPGTGRTVGDELTHLRGDDRREHERYAGPSVLTVPHGVVATYVHSALKPGLGKIGVLVAVESASPSSRGAGDPGSPDRHARRRNPAGRARRDHCRRPGCAGAGEGRAVPSRPVPPASPTPSSRRWSRGASGNTTRRSCCWSRSGCMTARAVCVSVVKKAGADLGRLSPASSSAKASTSRPAVILPPRSRSCGGYCIRATRFDGRKFAHAVRSF